MKASPGPDVLPTLADFAGHRNPRNMKRTDTNAAVTGKLLGGHHGTGRKPQRRVAALSAGDDEQASRMTPPHLRKSREALAASYAGTAAGLRAASS